MTSGVPAPAASAPLAVLPSSGGGPVLGTEVVVWTVPGQVPVVVTSLHLTLSGYELDSNWVLRLYDDSGALLWSQATDHLVSG